MRIMVKDIDNDSYQVIEAAELYWDEDEDGAESFVCIDPVHIDDLYYESEPNAISKDLYQTLCQKLLVQGYVDMSQYRFEAKWLSEDSTEEN